MPAAIDLTGKVFGLLTVLRLSKTRIRGNRAWVCRCECGGRTTVPVAALRSGNTKSCGCRKRAVLGENTTKHGGVGSREYRSWTGMRRRCNNPNNADYKLYGGAGVRVCRRWDSFPHFLADMGPCPEGYTLDRINPRGDYRPENCRWADAKQQARNKRTSRLITYKGVTRPLAEWAELMGVSYLCLWKRIDRRGVEVLAALGETIHVERD